MRLAFASVLWLLVSLLCPNLGDGPTPAATPAATPAPLRRIRTQASSAPLADLLRDPEIQAWLQAQAAASADTRAAATTMPATAPEPASTQQAIADQLTAVRGFLGDLTAALPTLPAEIGHAWLILSLEFEDQGLFSVLLLIATFIGLGFGLEWLFWWATTGFRLRMIASAAGDGERSPPRRRPQARLRARGAGGLRRSAASAASSSSTGRRCCSRSCWATSRSSCRCG